MAAVNVSFEYTDAVIGLIQDTWTASGDFMQYLWQDKVLPVIGEDEWVHYVWGVGFWCNFVIHWVLSGIFIYMDVTNKPHFMRKYKVQPGTNEPFDLWYIWKISKVVLVNQIITIPLFFIGSYVRQLRPVPDIHTLPTLVTFLTHWAVYMILDDIGYYTIHKYFLHDRRYYKHYHKQHHELNAPMVITTLYCSKLEQLVNVATPSLGVYLLQPHISILLLWGIYSYILPLHNHMGYEVPYLFFLWPPASKHDFHHELPVNEMYGKHGIFDYLFGTDKRWRASLAKKKAIEEGNLNKNKANAIESKEE